MPLEVGADRLKARAVLVMASYFRLVASMGRVK